MDVQRFAKTDSKGAVIEYPLNAVRIKNRGHRLDMYEPVTPVRQPQYSQLTETIAERTPVRGVAGSLMQQWEVTTKPLTMLRTDMLSALADYRYQVETGGITLPDGTQIKTARDDQAMTNSAYNSLKNGLVSSTEWKSGNGWITVTLTELEPVATAVARHVAAAFGAERDVAEQIAQADQTALLALDLRGEFSAAYAARLQSLAT